MRTSRGGECADQCQALAREASRGIEEVGVDRGSSLIPSDDTRVGAARASASSGLVDTAPVNAFCGILIRGNASNIHGNSGRVSNADHTNSDARTSSTSRLAAVIFKSVKNDRTTDNRTGTDHRHQRIVDGELGSSRALVVIDIAHITGMARENGEDRMRQRSRVPVTTSRRSIGRRQVTIDVDVESVLASINNAIQLSAHQNRAGAGFAEEDNSTRNVADGGRENGDCLGDVAWIDR